MARGSQARTRAVEGEGAGASNHPTAGGKVKMPKISMQQIIDAVESGEDMGFCLACGDEAYGVEPDARKYECESCGKEKVYGAEELLLMVGA